MCADIVSPHVRSRNMSRIRGRDTGPERALRRLLTDMGYRYRLQYTRLPGRPDVAMPGRKRVIWVHGCFWHQHPGCGRATMPTTRREFWQAKLEGNRDRDERTRREVEGLGWATLVIWECELAHPEQVRVRLQAFLVPIGDKAAGQDPSTRDGGVV